MSLGDIDTRRWRPWLSATSSVLRRRLETRGVPSGPSRLSRPSTFGRSASSSRQIGRIRDLALFDCGIDAKLRGCDLVKLKVSDVAPGGVLRERATVIQQKTGRPVPFEITDSTREALLAWLKLRGTQRDDWLFPSRSRPGHHIGTRQYGRQVDRWVTMIDLEPRAYGTHSLRRTKVAMLYKKTGNLATATSFFLPLIQEQLGDATGMSMVHVNRVLKYLSAEGLATMKAGHVTLLNPGRLAKLAGFDPSYLHLSGSAPRGGMAGEESRDNRAESGRQRVSVGASDDT